ncbi:MAG: PQQ-binding-like beta-propeller repeat protein [Rickettsiales bacterium]|jgi:outer membrane protein assembly factor BamB|nr:PQQ-binding-like beta-propeller repeat protein [Rickettsiales bacterium]
MNKNLNLIPNLIIKYISNVIRFGIRISRMSIGVIAVFMLLVSCSSGSNKKILKDSIYIYEIQNNIYSQLSNKVYALDKNQANYNNMIGNIELDSLKVRNTIKIKSRKDNMLNSNILIDSGFIYLLDSNNILYKKSITNPKESFALSLHNSDSSFSTLSKKISLNNGKIIASIGNNTIYQIDIESFTLSWSKDISNIVRASNIIDNNNAYASTIDNVIYALDQNNGKIKWKRELDSKQTSIYGSGYLSDYENNIIFTSSLGETVSLNKNNGEILWSDKINLTSIHNSEYDMFDSEFKPIIEGNRYYSWTYSGSIISYNIASGVRKWTLDVRPITNLWLFGDIIYTVGADNNIIAIDKNDGKIIWYKPLDKITKIDSEDYNEQNISTIFVTNNKLAILSKSGQILLLDPMQGDYLSKKRFGKNVISLPYNYKNNLYFQDQNGNIKIYH